MVHVAAFFYLHGVRCRVFLPAWCTLPRFFYLYSLDYHLSFQTFIILGGGAFFSASARFFWSGTCNFNEKSTS
ncbi:hypothetical protein EDD15DRAFT_2278887 [Pisolithus albus]|nr:hypothetical protein EDD15DRAFT_2278887 [Pisolithus albus]